MEQLFTKIHASIRANPVSEKAKVKANPDRAHKKFRQQRLTVQQRKERVAEKFRIAQSK
jgi:hypothetical protein